MEPFTNYEGIENDKTLSTIQKIALYQKAIEERLLYRCFIQGRDISDKTFNPIWTGLFANLQRLGGAFCPPPPPPLLTWLFQVRRG